MAQKHGPYQKGTKMLEAFETWVEHRMEKVCSTEHTTKKSYDATNGGRGKSSLRDIRAIELVAY